MHIVFSMSETQTELCVALLQPTLLPASRCRGQSSVSSYSVCDFYTRNGTAAAVLPKRQLHRASYESTAFSHLRSLLKGMFRLWVHEGVATVWMYAAANNKKKKKKKKKKKSTQKDMIECVPNYTSTYARKQGYNWTKNTGMNMYQNQ